MIMAISGLSEDQFKSQIGLSGVANLGTFDPVSAMTSGNELAIRNVLRMYFVQLRIAPRRASRALRRRA
jgi:hypothetical protein